MVQNASIVKKNRFLQLIYISLIRVRSVVRVHCGPYKKDSDICYYPFYFVVVGGEPHFGSSARWLNEFADGRSLTSPDSEQIEYIVAKQLVRNSVSVEQIHDRAKCFCGCAI